MFLWVYFVLYAATSIGIALWPEFMERHPPSKEPNMIRSPSRTNLVPTDTGDSRSSLQRYRDSDDEQRAAGVGVPPLHLDSAQADCWRELVALPASKALTGGDRWRVEMAAKLMVTVRSGEFKDFELRSLNGMLGQMGAPLVEGAHKPV